MYIITPPRSFTLLSGLPTNLVGACPLIRLGAPNNRPCVPLSAVGGVEVTSRPLLLNVDKMFQKDTKAHKRGEHEERPEADRRTGKGPLKLQTGTSSNLYLSRRFYRIKADTVTLRTSVKQMLSPTRTKRV